MSRIGSVGRSLLVAGAVAAGFWVSTGATGVARDTGGAGPVPTAVAPESRLVASDGASPRARDRAPARGRTAAAGGHRRRALDGPGRAQSCSETTLWRGGMEGGGLDDWTDAGVGGWLGSGGGESNSGAADSTASTAVSRTGRWSAELTWTGPGESGTRLFRWHELQHTRALYAEAWFFLPQEPTLTGEASQNRTVNLMQFKSIDDDGSRNDPFWYLVMKEKAGRVRPVVTWGAQSGIAGPTIEDGVGFKDYYDETLTFPVGRWFRIRAYIRQSSGYDGAVKFWVDHRLVASRGGVRTGHRNDAGNPWGVTQHWSVNSYSDGLAPAPFSIYVDDARIFTLSCPR